MKLDPAPMRVFGDVNRHLRSWPVRLPAIEGHEAASLAVHREMAGASD